VERPVTVVIVDGNPGTRAGLARRLMQVPGISVVAEGGDEEEAVRVVGERRPDGVVADVPRMAPDAGAFLGRLMRAAPEAGIVVLTAYLTERERSDLVQAGARALLLKEIDSGALARAIETVAGRRLGEERRTEA
jgi:DNA-binding NarL/FixJ family response regulator